MRMNLFGSTRVGVCRGWAHPAARQQVISVAL